MPQFAAHLSLMYPELPLLDRFAAAARDGFRAVELHFPYAVDPREIAARLQDNGLQLVLFDAPAGGFAPADMAHAWDQGARGLAAQPGREAEFRAGVLDALRYAERLGCPYINVLCGTVPPGVERESLKALCVDNLRWAADQAGRAGQVLGVAVEAGAVGGPGRTAEGQQPRRDLRAAGEMAASEWLAAHGVFSRFGPVGCAAHASAAGRLPCHAPDTPALDTFVRKIRASE